MDWKDPFYLVQPAYAKRMADNLVEALRDRGAYGVAFRDLGSLLSGDYNVNDLVTREQVKQMQIASLLGAKAVGEAVMIKEGYDYALPYADMVTDMDLEGIRYSILDASVPFYQIAIHGLVDYTGQPINLAEDWETELLRCAEYGAGLNFTFMGAEGQLLQDSLYSGYYGASWEAWRDTAKAMIAAYQADLAGLNRERIVGHEQVAAGVTATAFEGGRKVFVNYTGQDYEAGGVTVPARSYRVTGGDR
jgi:hypothetical protein